MSAMDHPLGDCIAHLNLVCPDSACWPVRDRVPNSDYSQGSLELGVGTGQHQQSKTDLKSRYSLVVQRRDFERLKCQSA